jgi:hypothetical protein
MPPNLHFTSEIFEMAGQIKSLPLSAAQLKPGNNQEYFLAF